MVANRSVQLSVKSVFDRLGHSIRCCENENENLSIYLGQSNYTEMFVPLGSLRLYGNLFVVNWGNYENLLIGYKCILVYSFDTYYSTFFRSFPTDIYYCCYSNYNCVQIIIVFCSTTCTGTVTGTNLTY